MPEFEEADKFKPSSTRRPLYLQYYSSVPVWRGTEGDGVDTHRERHLEEYILTPSNKGEKAYGCCLDLMTCSAKHLRNCEVAKLRNCEAFPASHCELNCKLLAKMGIALISGPAGLWAKGLSLFSLSSSL